MLIALTTLVAVYYTSNNLLENKAKSIIYKSKMFANMDH